MTGEAMNVAVEPDILCEDLVKIYSTEGVEVQALQGLSLRVERGEVVAIVGASGSGKSTLLTILSGLDTPTGGRAVVAGTDLHSMTPKRRVDYQRHTVGFVWQQTARNLVPYLTARENVEAPMILAGGIPAAQRRERAEDLLTRLGLGHRFDAMPGHLSGGEQQRVATAVALANTPKVLLADEPTGALDRATSAELLDLMRETSESLGVTMLVVTHDPTVADHVRRTIQIRDGRTSTETLRRKELAEDGTEVDVAEEFTVIDRTGRLQLPEHFVTDLGLRDRVRVELENDHASVWPATAENAARTEERAAETASVAHTVDDSDLETDPAPPTRRGRRAAPLTEEQRAAEERAREEARGAAAEVEKDTGGTPTLGASQQEDGDD